MQADGSIIIDTQINSDGFIAGSKELEQHIRSMSSSLSDLSEKAKNALDKQVNSFIKANQAYAAQEKKVEELKKKVEELGKEKVPTEDYELAQKEVNKYRNALDAALERKKRFEETGGKTNSNAYKRMMYDIDQVKMKLDEANAAKRQLELSGGAYVSGIDTAAGSVATSQLEQAEQRLANMNSSLNNSYAALNQKIGEYSGQASGASMETSGLASRARSMASSVAAGAKNLAKMAGRGIINGLKKVGSAISGIGKKSKSAFSVKNILKYTLGIRSLFVLVNKLRGYVVDGFNNLAQYSGETNKSLSMLKSSLTQLKNSLATAFAPILNVAAPILTKLINMASMAATAVGQLMAAITGKGTYVKAVAVQEDYAASLDKTAASTEKAKKEAEGYLSPLDEINKLEKKDTTDTSSAASGVSPKDMFETAKVDTPFIDLAKKIKESWKNADFTALGAMLGEKINSGLEKIPWDKIRATASKIGKSVATFLNGGIETVDWNLVGSTLANGVNTIIDLAYSFVENFHWKSFGDAIGNGLSGIFQTFDAKKFAKGASDLVKGFLDSIISFAKSTDWKSMWLRIIELIVNVDWLGIVKKILEAGYYIIKGLVEGLIQAIKETDWKAIWDSIVQSFKDFFGIHSPSTLFAEFGKNIIQGLVNGIQGLLQSVYDVFGKLKDGISRKFDEIKSAATTFGSTLKDNLVSAFTLMKEKVLSIWDALKNGLKTPINGIIGFLNGMIDGLVDAINNVVKTLNKINVKVPKWVPKYGGKKFGFDLDTVSAPRIPYLATGAVIPPNAPFMAMLGDQKNGKNLEMPEGLLRKIVREESGQKSGGSYRFTAQLNRRVLFDEFIAEAKMRRDASGKNPLELA